MPSTVTTVEKFAASTTEAQINKEIELRLKAGAITSKVDKKAPRWTLKTRWNVFGEQ